jgi:arylsulfatase A-like enzyme
MKHRLARRAFRSASIPLGAALLLLFACSRAAPPVPEEIGTVEPGVRHPDRSLSPARKILLVTVDTLRADHVGAYGATVPTPAIDRLAAEGVLVEEARTPTPTTAPAHASLFTGRYPWNHGVLDNAVAIPEEIDLLAETLREHGFTTVGFVASFILNPDFGFGRGFEKFGYLPNRSNVWRGDSKGRFYALARRATNSALRWLASHRQEREAPFFLWVHYFDPHTPYAPPEGFRRDPDETIDLAGKTLPHGIADFDELRGMIRDYRGEVAYVDSEIGRLLEGLETFGIADETTVIFTADHGEGLGDHGLLEHGKNLYEELVRVPMIFRGPGIPRGIRLRGPAQLEDLHPTILAVAGVPFPGPTDGFDLLAWIRGLEPESPRRQGLGRRKILDDEPDLFYRVLGSEKWIGRTDRRGRTYRLDEDPREGSERRGGRMPPALREQIEGASPRPRRTGKESPDPETLEALRALGYIE